MHGGPGSLLEEEGGGGVEPGGRAQQVRETFGRFTTFTGKI